MSKRVVIAVLILVLFVLVFGESNNYRLSNPFVLSDTPSKYWVSIAGGSMYPGKYFSYDPFCRLAANADDFKDRFIHITQKTLYIDGVVSGGINNLWKHFGFGLSWEWSKFNYYGYTFDDCDKYIIIWMYELPLSKTAGIININYSYKRHQFGLDFEYTRLTVFEINVLDTTDMIEVIDGIGLGINYKYYFVNIGYKIAKICPYVEVQLSNSWLLPCKSPYEDYYPNDFYIMTVGVRLGLQFGVF